MSSYQTLNVHYDDDICTIMINRPNDNNTINDQMIVDFTQVLVECEYRAKVVVIEGQPDVFCFGADFAELKANLNGSRGQPDPGPLYDVWLKLANGPFVTIAHVRGKVNAGGIGFVAACDIVISEQSAVYSLSELLFGLMPACVLPFLVRRMGQPKANYMTLMTTPVSAEKALEWGLADAVADNSKQLLRKHLLRLRLLSKDGILRYKRYMNQLDESLYTSKEKALAANVAVFADQDNLDKIVRYVNTGQFPWEK
jgi:polyketide biosynthesis enoyl-CoA hydratase PksH